MTGDGLLGGLRFFREGGGLIDGASGLRCGGDVAGRPGERQPGERRGDLALSGDLHGRIGRGRGGVVQAALGAGERPGAVARRLAVVQAVGQRGDRLDRATDGLVGALRRLDRLSGLFGAADGLRLFERRVGRLQPSQRRRQPSLISRRRIFPLFLLPFSLFLFLLLPRPSPLLIGQLVGDFIGGCLEIQLLVEPFEPQP